MNELEKFEEEFLTNPAKKSCYLSGDEKREIVRWLKSHDQRLLKEIKDKVIKEIERAVKESEKELGSPNVYIDMVGEIAIENIENLITNLEK